MSTSTVSRALRDSHEIGAETKQMVLDYAKKVNSGMKLQLSIINSLGPSAKYTEVSGFLNDETGKSAKAIAEYLERSFTEDFMEVS